MNLLVTGGCGFIGTNLVRHLVLDIGHSVTNVDLLTYAGSAHSLDDLAADDRYELVVADVANVAAMSTLFSRVRPDAVLHLAAESHVDRSIENPATFIHTNVTGTASLLQAALGYWQSLSADGQASFRFLHVSTDEVYGSLGADDPPFTEVSRYDPHSPYAASKASADHLARAWHDTYGLPVLVTNCSNNYGPYQFPEKLIPTVILKALAGEPIPVYGSGDNVRDWLSVHDHVLALVRVLEAGVPGRTYNVGGSNELRNIDLVERLCAMLDEIAPSADGRPHAELITFVTDRPGHDKRYAIDASRIRDELGWEPTPDAAAALRSTVQWYVDNRAWWERILGEGHGLERLGLRNERASEEAR